MIGGIKLFSSNLSLQLFTILYSSLASSFGISIFLGHFPLIWAQLYMQGPNLLGMRPNSDNRWKESFSRHGVVSGGASPAITVNIYQTLAKYKVPNYAPLTCFPSGRFNVVYRPSVVDVTNTPSGSAAAPLDDFRARFNGCRYPNCGVSHSHDKLSPTYWVFFTHRLRFVFVSAAKSVVHSVYFVCIQRNTLFLAHNCHVWLCLFKLRDATYHVVLNIAEIKTRATNFTRHDNFSSIGVRSIDRTPIDGAECLLMARTPIHGVSISLSASRNDRFAGGCRNSLNHRTLYSLCAGG
ncbi:hypothetical protein B0H11DRAFT_1301480 [Mycena galericulata]|nr:hypothetical protein B0H11DRAFT_1301480 [Mycena galericulata]